MKKLFIILIVLLIGSELFAQKKISETELINKDRTADFEYLSAPDSIGIRTQLKMPSQNLNKTQAQLKLPYPIIFIHGLNSNCETWNSFTNYLDLNYGLTYGGRIDYCLNNDDSNYTSNLSSDLALYTASTSLIVGDYYFINFDIGIDGSFHPNGNANEVLSNQSAIAKQGRAVADAIQIILQKTGKDKVILMAHSMGGLAARDYLQNWVQTDGFHHVAKLATTGTPHGGSDRITGGVALSGVDCKSEAYRDLRTSYSGSGNPGIYLFGGVENNTVTDLSFCSNFYNVDVNCNETINENVMGLNNKAIPLDVIYACAIGIGSALGGDGAVGQQQANLNNYVALTFPADIFILDEPSSGSTTPMWHTDLPLLVEANINLLDEPNEYALSYDINYGITYTGFTTRQSVKGYNNDYTDYDDYKFSVLTNSNVSVNVSNIALSNLMVRIIDPSGTTIGSIVKSSGASSVNFSRNLVAGDYYLEIYGTPTASSYKYPYNFILNSISVNGVSEITDEMNFLIYPNPASDLLTIKTSSIETLGSFYTINDQLGREVLNGKLTDNTNIIDINNLPKGFYLIQISNNKKQTFKFIKE
jgi:pimeloyl-ACP methyl ester carboxylesterase